MHKSLLNRLEVHFIAFIKKCVEHNKLELTYEVIHTSNEEIHEEILYFTDC